MRLCSLLLVLAAPLAANAGKPDAEQVKAAMGMVDVMAKEDIEKEMRTRLLFQACSEMAGCADGCGPLLSAIARPEFDVTMRATALDQCTTLDFKAAHAKDPKLTPEAWFARHLGKFLDAVAPLVPKASRAQWKANRTKAAL